MKWVRILKATNWKYAIGEIALIVVGVSLALMANSLYTSRLEHQQEIRILEQIAKALEADARVLRQQVQVLRQSEQELAVLLNALRSEDVIGPDSRSSFGAVTTWRGISLRMGPYEELKNHGLSLISNDSLREELVDLYDSSFQNLAISTENDVIFSRDLALPYFYSNFRRSADGDWEPVRGYDSLKDDVVFENLVTAKLNRLQRFVLPNYDAFLQLTEQVLSEVRDELDSP